MERQVAVITASEPVRVLVVTEVLLYREGLSASLRGRETVRVVGMASTYDDATAQVTALHPQVVVLDVSVPRSLALVRTIRADAPQVRIVAFAISESDYEILACAEAGVAGYVTADSSLDELVGAIEGAARGELRCSPRTAAVLLQRITALSQSPSTPTVAVLTAREREIASLIELGLSNKQIAGQLHIELATVKNHVHNILDKLRVSTRGEVAAHVRRAAPQRSLRPTPPRPYVVPLAEL